MGILKRPVCLSASHRTLLAGVSYGRCDFRICAKTGVLNFLEINPNCGIFYPAGQRHIPPKRVG